MLKGLISDNTTPLDTNAVTKKRGGTKAVGTEKRSGASTANIKLERSFWGVSLPEIDMEVQGYMNAIRESSGVNYIVLENHITDSAEGNESSSFKCKITFGLKPVSVKSTKTVKSSRVVHFSNRDFSLLAEDIDRWLLKEKCYKVSDIRYATHVEYVGSPEWQDAVVVFTPVVSIEAS